MFRSVNDLRHYTLQATDGEMGKVYDCFFDDESWIIRYLVVDTGTWLPGRKVLLPPQVLGEPAWLQHSLPVQLTRQQIKESPDMDTDKPVSRQQEVTLARYYGWPMYWAEPGNWPGVMTPSVPTPSTPPLPTAEVQERGDPHLQSAREVSGYHIQASEGEIGHVEDFVLDDETWSIRYLVVSTRNWLPGRQVLISPEWLDTGISYGTATVSVTLTRDQIKNSPPYDPSTPINRKYELTLYDFYGRPGYWVRQQNKETPK